ncbi:hypothetical protein [Tardiphaga sp. P9-11]|uniref:hypothetical protein n=1 Tax=Tardiphaga sp. P9-11 TaxID=2024614 RepID=UPI0011F254D3|nr:hypothetical protein [Tardiphaga sp. P9-11]
MLERATIVEDEIDVEQVVLNYQRLICEALNQMEVAEVRQLILEIEGELDKTGSSASPMRRQAAEVLRRARRLPVGPDRNELRQIAHALLWLEEKGLSLKALRRVEDRSKSEPTES